MMGRRRSITGKSAGINVMLPSPTPMSTPENNLAIAFDALEKGIAPIPIIEGTKIPAAKWKEWQTKLPPEDLVREWFSLRRNIAIVTSGLVVFDCDDPANAEL